MKRKLQVVLLDDAWKIIESVTTEANQDFKNGSINYSDVVNEMILTAKVDAKTLQAKHTNIRKSLRSLAAQKEIDFDAAIKALQEMKGKVVRKPLKAAQVNEGLAV